MLIWKVKKGADRRARGAHPWIFSNELQESPKGIPLGEPVELRDHNNQFLARGYGNPQSLISFRALSFESANSNPWTHEFIIQKLLTNWQQRKTFGFEGSFRLCFGESDYCPGLVLDYYLVKPAGAASETPEPPIYQVFCCQIVTAGMDRLLRNQTSDQSGLESFFKALVEKATSMGLSSFDWDHSAVVIRNDVAVRKLEGLAIESPHVLKNIQGMDLSNGTIAVISQSQSNKLIWLHCDLVEGQKTGFFLDQTFNIGVACDLVKSWKNRKVRILDLCCYVGHWSSQLGSLLKAHGNEVEVTLVDASESALNKARNNISRLGLPVNLQKMDVLVDLEKLPTNHFDIVIADPPAFIKAKKDIPIGIHAYLKMNTQAFRLVKSGGIVVSCSCSGLLTEEDFREALRKAIHRNGRQTRGIGRGGHAADHPTLIQFPEGNYLKMFIHSIDQEN